MSAPLWTMSHSSSRGALRSLIVRHCAASSFQPQHYKLTDRRRYSSNTLTLDDRLFPSVRVLLSLYGLSVRDFDATATGGGGGGGVRSGHGGRRILKGDVLRLIQQRRLEPLPPHQRAKKMGSEQQQQDAMKLETMSRPTPGKAGSARLASGRQWKDVSVDAERAADAGRVLERKRHAPHTYVVCEMPVDGIISKVNDKRGVGRIVAHMVEQEIGLSLKQLQHPQQVTQGSFVVVDLTAQQADDTVGESEDDGDILGVGVGGVSGVQCLAVAAENTTIGIGVGEVETRVMPSEQYQQQWEQENDDDDGDDDGALSVSSLDLRTVQLVQVSVSADATLADEALIAAALHRVKERCQMAAEAAVGDIEL